MSKKWITWLVSGLMTIRGKLDWKKGNWNDGSFAHGIELLCHYFNNYSFLVYVQVHSGQCRISNAWITEILKNSKVMMYDKAFATEAWFIASCIHYAQEWTVNTIARAHKHNTVQIYDNFQHTLSYTPIYENKPPHGGYNTGGAYYSGRICYAFSANKIDPF